MLVLFKFKNFGPFKDESVFDMRAIKSYKEHPYNLHVENEKSSLVKVAAIYGANASGKSNFIEAYNCFLKIVRLSFSGKDKGDLRSVLSQCYYPYFFDDDASSSDTEFEAIYHRDNYEYRYGYIYNKDQICYEWLYRRSLDSNRQTTIFERDRDGIKLGSSVKKSCEKYISNIDEDVLVLSFLSSLKLRNHVFKTTLDCVTDVMTFSLSCAASIQDLLEFYFEYAFDDEEKPKLLEFLKAIDVGIKDVRVEKNSNKVLIYTSHLGRNKKYYDVPIDIESDGTKKAIVLYSLVKIAILQHETLLVDELNNQLHPLLLKYIVDLFYDETTSGQLIYTTHDTTLLDKRYMRRDQIWFTHKNKDGESTLYSLAEFKIRNDMSFGKEYLGGVFGGIPELEEFSLQEV